MKTILHLLLIMFVLFIAAGCDRGEDPEKTPETVKIGVIAPLTGPQEQWGKNGLLGVKTAIAAHPVLRSGYIPEIILEDDSNEPAVTRQKLKKLVEKDKVSAVLMFSESQAVLNAIQDIDEYRTPVLVFLSTHPDVTKNEWVTQVPFDDITQGTVAALYVMDEMLIDDVAVFRDEENPHSIFLADEFVSTFKEAGGKIELISAEEGMKNLRSIIIDLKKKGVKLLYLPLDAESVVEIERETRDFGWNPEVMVGDGIFSAIQLQHEDDIDLLEGMLATEVYSHELPFTEYADKMIKIFKDLKKKNDRGTVFSALGCEGTSILLAAMDRCHESRDRSCINNMLRSTENFQGFVGRVRVRPDGRTERPIFINTIENQKLRFIVKIY